MSHLVQQQPEISVGAWECPGWCRTWYTTAWDLCGCDTSVFILKAEHIAEILWHIEIEQICHLQSMLLSNKPSLSLQTSTHSLLMRSNTYPAHQHNSTFPKEHNSYKNSSTKSLPSKGCILLKSSWHHAWGWQCEPINAKDVKVCLTYHTGSEGTLCWWNDDGWAHTMSESGMRTDWTGHTLWWSHKCSAGKQTHRRRPKIAPQKFRACTNYRKLNESLHIYSLIFFVQVNLNSTIIQPFILQCFCHGLLHSFLLLLLLLFLLPLICSWGTWGLVLGATESCHVSTWHLSSLDCLYTHCESIAENVLSAGSSASLTANNIHSIYGDCYFVASPLW